LKTDLVTARLPLKLKQRLAKVAEIAETGLSPLIAELIEWGLDSVDTRATRLARQVQWRKSHLTNRY